MSQPALFRAFPQLAERVPWVALGSFPTPVERVTGLLPPSVELWVKREDASGRLYGGNKVRKLEFVLAEARAAGATRVATLGGWGSHHVLATAIYGHALGLAVEAVVFPQPLTEHVRMQLAADAAAGARLRRTRSYLGVPTAVLAARRGAFWIPGGGSSTAGTLGWMSAACEIQEQIACGELSQPDVIYVALGTGGTAAGLMAGLAAPAPEVVAVRVVDRVVANASTTRRRARQARRFVAAGDAPLAPLRVEHRFFGGAYGRSTPAADAAVARAAAHGLRLEPTYTGKTLAALLADAEAGRLDGKRVLFIHSYNGVDLQPLLAASAPAKL